MTEKQEGLPNSRCTDEINKLRTEKFILNLAITIITAILVFGFLIFIHEFGHYIFARIFKVTITEFSIGMGPKIVWYDSKKTGIRYAISMIPIGGYVAMVGEDAESDDPNSFDRKPAWQRLIITVAGASVNIIAGILALFVFVGIIFASSDSGIGGTTVAEFVEYKTEDGESVASSEDSGLRVGDRIIAIDGSSVKIADELSYEIMRRGYEPVDITVIRGGEEIVLYDVVFPGGEAEGQSLGKMDFKIYAEEKTFGNFFVHSFRKAFLIVRMCWESIFDLITGRYTLAAVSGPVGISEAIGEAASNGFGNLLYLVALISINLGIMNLLPIPALDGGRTVLLIVEMISKKRVPKKIESTVNAVFLALLLGLSLVIMAKDIIGLF